MMRASSVGMTFTFEAENAEEKAVLDCMMYLACAFHNRRTNPEIAAKDLHTAKEHAQKTACPWIGGWVKSALNELKKENE